MNDDKRECPINGVHEPLERPNRWNGNTDTIRVSLLGDRHGDIYCCVCKHCRVIYMRTASE